VGQKQEVPIEASAALTAGSLSVPSGEYARRWRQWSGRVVVRPMPGVVLGASASRGPWLAASLADEYPGSATQSALGFDAEFSRARWLVRTEGVFSRWALPRLAAPFAPGPLHALALSGEGRYRLLPGLYAAARLDHLGFGTIVGRTGAASWEAPVSRLELGAGYSLRRNVLLKVAWQWNWRTAPTATRRGVVAAQVATWF
jgi:hypothetical protein